MDMPVNYLNMKNVFKDVAILFFASAILFPASGFSVHSGEEFVAQRHTTVSGDSVYVCLSQEAYAYHNNYYCRGLKKCEHSIKYVPVEKAQAMRRRPCGYCY